jgi:hypothetical protein
MSEITNIKRFILRALLAMQGMPMPGEALDQAVKGAVPPRPLQSDIESARNQLEEGGFIIGTKDDLDGSVSWALTMKGQIRAKQL